MELAIIGAGAAVGGLVLGAVIGAWLTNRKMRRQYEDLRVEIVSLKRNAEGRLANDTPELETLLRSLQGAVEETYKAVEALEAQGRIMREKTDCGREIVLSSRNIVDMIDDFSGGSIEMREDAEPIRAQYEKAANKKTPPQLD